MSRQRNQAKPKPVLYGDRPVYPVSEFVRGVSSWLGRLPAVWVDGELTEIDRHGATAFLTLKDPEDGTSLQVTAPWRVVAALPAELSDGQRVHVYGWPELWRPRAAFQLRAERIELVGLGAVLLRLEALKRKLAAEGLFARERKRPLPALPRLIGLVTGVDAAARHDVVTTITERFPPARMLVAETVVQGPRAPLSVASALRRLAGAGADVIVIARGGGSFDDLLPFSDERLVRAIAASPVPVVSAIGHEQDLPLCDLVADARASTPTAVARLVVPDWTELNEALDDLRHRLREGVLDRLDRARERLAQDRLHLLRAPALLLERKGSSLASSRERLTRAPRVLLERQRAATEALAGKLAALSPEATVRRGYAIVRTEGRVVRSSLQLAPRDLVDVELAEGGFRGRVEETRA